MFRTAKLVAALELSTRKCYLAPIATAFTAAIKAAFEHFLRQFLPMCTSLEYLGFFLAPAATLQQSFERQWAKAKTKDDNDIS